MKTPRQIIDTYELPSALVDAGQMHATGPWYDIRAEGDRASVRIYGIIGDWWEGLDAATFVTQLDALQVDHIDLHLNSEGGAVWDALAIYHTLREHPAQVTTIVDGLAASAASLILQAGDVRIARSGTRVMLHEAAGGVYGKADELRAHAATLDAVTLDLAGIYAARSGKDTPEDWNAILHDGDTFYSATEALDAALIDQVDTTQPTNRLQHRQPTNLKKETPAMDPDTDDVTARLDELERDIQLIHHRPAGPQADLSALHSFASYGAYVQAVSRGDDLARQALDQLRAAYTGPAEADTIMLPSWVGMITAAMQALQPTLALFQHTYDLPETGNALEYGVVTEASAATGPQEKWGDAFTKDATVKLTTATVNLKTIGGWAEYARQWVARSSVPVLDLLWQALAFSYARSVEAIARAQLDAVWTARTAVGVAPIASTSKAVGDLTALDWRDLLIDVREALYGSSWPLDGFIASPDVYRALARLSEERPALQPRQAPTDKVGTLDLSALSGDLDGFTIRSLPGWGSGRFAGYWGGAIRVQEKPGAPLQLTGSEDVTNLVKPISVWGEVADYAPVPEAIRPVRFGA